MKKNLKILILLFVTLFVGVGAILMLGNSRKHGDKISIVTTNFPAYDFARAVAGDKADIKMLIKPGAELHNYEPSPSDIIDIKNSDLVIYNGGESDEWIEDDLIGNVKVFKMMNAVELVEEEAVEGMEGDEEESEEAEYDEHIWTSLRNAQKIINNLTDTLSEISPENKAYFEQNTKNYNQRLADIDTRFQEIISGAKRKTLVFGDRFPLRYFVEDYDLDYYAAFPGCSDQTEASNQTIAFLVDKVKSEKIPVVLKIEMSSDAIARTIAREAGVKYLTFNSAHTISAEDFSNGKTYADIMESNLEAIREALN
ncbi:MAG: metal ABC transporter substrate-binding protein [Candidatus Saccharibacteria bacterium]|nr:metal ABC transporter substrate-binding protein [Candidatus Saccharibacteria bacterium]